MRKGKAAQSRAKDVEKARRRWPWGVILLVAISLAVFANSLVNDFVGDDKDQLLGNPVVTNHQFVRAVLTGVWAFRGGKNNYYRPLQLVVYVLFHALFGVHAFPFHLFSVLLHAANCLIVYRLALPIVNRPRAALASALVFAVHPIHTEVIDWIAAYPDLIMTSVVLAGMWLFVRKSEELRAPRIAAHCALYLAALSLKETGVMLLPLCVAFERICLGRKWVDLKRNLTLYGAMAATFFLYVAARWKVMGSLAPAQGMYFQLTPVQFALSVVVTAAQYAGRLIFPGDLNYFHVFHPTVAINAWFLIALIVLAALTAAASWRGTPAPVRFGLVWMALSLAPALNLMGVGQNVFAERYLYLPSVGFAWVAGWAWSWCSERQPAIAWAAGIAILGAFCWQTATRNLDWRDDLTMLRKTVRQSPDAGIMHNNLAGLYVHRDEFDLALEEERQAVRCEPRSGLFHRQYGMLLVLHYPDQAMRELEEAVRLEPSDTTARELLEELRQATNERPPH
jgi:hypothetical protein